MTYAKSEPWECENCNFTGLMTPRQQHVHNTRSCKKKGRVIICTKYYLDNIV